MSARSRPGTFAVPWRRRHGSRSGGAGRWRPAGLLLGLLLVLATSPAQTFESAAQASTSPAEPVAGGATAMSANWVVLDVIGTAAWRAVGEGQWREFMPGEVLPPGCEIETGADGEVTLVAGGDQLIVAPLGRLIVPEVSPDQDRLLRHERGRILVHIEPRTGRKVRVDTPLLSLGIKGTTFEVEVGADQDSVVVHDGEVEVTPRGQEDPVALGAGEGLRQSATPGTPATHFDLPDRDAPSLPVTGPASQGSPQADGDVIEGQSATPGSPATHFALPDRDPPSLPDPGPASDGSSRADGEVVEDRTTPDQLGASRTPERSPRVQRPSGSHPPAAAKSRAERSFGWVDDWASSWAWVAIAGVALVLLTIPVLALVQNLREQRSGQSQAEGRRRRELIRG